MSSDPKHIAMLVRSSSAVLKDLCWRGPSGQAVFKRAPAARCYDISRRYFNASRPRWIKTADMKESDLAAVKVDGRRLMDTLHHTCKFGTGLRWGRQVCFRECQVFWADARGLISTFDMCATIEEEAGLTYYYNIQ